MEIVQSCLVVSSRALCRCFGHLEVETVFLRPCVFGGWSGAQRRRVVPFTTVGCHCRYIILPHSAAHAALGMRTVLAGA